MFGRSVCGGRVWLHGRLGEARVAGPGAARDGGRLWATRWGVERERQRRRLRAGLWGWGCACCVGVCVRLQRRACVVTCRPEGLEEKLAILLGRGKDFADECAYLVHLLVSSGKRYCGAGLRSTRRRTLLMAWYPQLRGCSGLGGGSVLVPGTAWTCVWAVGMAQIQGTFPVDGQQRLNHWVRQSPASCRW